MQEIRAEVGGGRLIRHGRIIRTLRYYSRVISNLINLSALMYFFPVEIRLYSTPRGLPVSKTRSSQVPPSY